MKRHAFWPGTPRGPAHEAADGLAEEQLGGGGGGEDADAQAGDVDALGHHAHGHDPRVGAAGEAGDARRRHRGRRRSPRRALARRSAVRSSVGDAPGVLLVDGDHQAAGVGLASRRIAGELVVGLRAAPSGSHSPSSESAVRSRWLGAGRVERRRRSVAAWSEPSGAAPLHVAVDAGEVDGPHDAAVGERVAVAVLEVGHRLVERGSARTGWRGCRSGTACPRAPGGGAARLEGVADRVAPGPVVAGVVDLVEDHEGVARPAARARAALDATCW